MRREAERGTLTFPVNAHRDGRATDGSEAARRRPFPGFLSGATCPMGCAETQTQAHPPALWSVRRAPARIGHLTHPRLISAQIPPFPRPKPHDPTGTFPAESRQTNEKAPRSAPYIRDDRFIGWREKRVRGAVRGQYGDCGKRRGYGSVFGEILRWGLMSPPAPSLWAFSPVLPDRGRFAIIGAS